MPAASDTTHEAETLYLMGKYDEALSSLNQAIEAAVSPQGTLEALPLAELKAGSPISETLRHKFKEAKIIRTTSGPVAVLPLSTSDQNTMWLVTHQKVRGKQLYLLVKPPEGEPDKWNLYQLTSACARAFAHRGETYFQRGLAILRKNPYQEGQDAFNENAEVGLTNLDLALKLNPTYAWAYAKKGEIYRVRGNQYKPMKDRKKDYDEALKCFDQAVKLNPTYTWALAHLGATICNARKSKRYKKALEHLREADRLMGWKYAWAVAYQGAIHLQRAMEGTRNLAREYDASMVDLMAAIMMDNTILNNVTEPGQRYRDVYLGYAGLLFKVGRYFESLRFCHLAIERATKGGLNYARALYYRALSLKALKESKKASHVRFIPEVDLSLWQEEGARTALITVAKKLSPVEIDVKGLLTPEDKKRLADLSHDDQGALEEICTMLVGVDSLISLDQTCADLPRLLDILAALFPEEHFNPEEATDWLTAPKNKHYIFDVVDQVIWNDLHLIEAIETVKKRASRRS